MCYWHSPPDKSLPLRVTDDRRKLLMRILVVAATSEEITPLVARLSRVSNGDAKIQHATYNSHDVDVLITGVGMVATAAWCSQSIARTTYDLGLNFGVCGAFDRALAPGSVVHVVADRLAELGAEDHDTFLTIQQLRLLDDDEFPFKGGELVNADPPVNPALSRLPAVNGITVNTSHGSAASIAAAAARFKPRVESMEGAAFMYACLINRLPFAQVRSVSNLVEPRNRGAWRMADAIRSLGEAAISILDCA
jgi:futalosine hydrolase